MDKLWQTRRAPVPLDDQAIPVEGEPLVDNMLLCFCTMYETDIYWYKAYS